MMSWSQKKAFFGLVFWNSPPEVIRYNLSNLTEVQLTNSARLSVFQSDCFQCAAVGAWVSFRKVTKREKNKSELGQKPLWRTLKPSLSYFPFFYVYFSSEHLFLSVWIRSCCGLRALDCTCADGPSREMSCGRCGAARGARGGLDA